jgi:MATE family, multidrug efflux pump
MSWVNRKKVSGEVDSKGAGSSSSWRPTMSDAMSPPTMAEPRGASAVARRAIEAWHLLRDAVRGAPLDLTAAPIGKALVMIAVPMIMEMVMESIFAVVDVFWVAHLGASAVAAVGLTESMMMILYAIAMGVSIGVMALVARRIGEKNAEAASHTAAQGIVLGLAIASAIGVTGALLAPQLMRAMGADGAVVATGTGFTRVMLGCSASVFLLFLINAVFRGAGDAALAMRALWLGNLLNIALGPCFIFGLGPFPALGVTGAAVATSIGRGIAVVYQLTLLARGRSRIAIARTHFAIDLRVMASVLRLAGSATAQMMLVMTSYVGVMRILSSFGSQPLAGYTIGFRLLMFVMLPVQGLSNAAATLVGQNLGARRPERAEQSAWQACFASAAFLTVAAVVFLTGARLLIGLFTQDPEVVEHGVRYLRIIGLGFPFYAFGMVLMQAFNGAGDPRTPTLINFMVFWIVQLPLAWLLSHHTQLGSTGVFVTLSVCFSVHAAVGIALFRRGRWKLIRV